MGLIKIHYIKKILSTFWCDVWIWSYYLPRNYFVPSQATHQTYSAICKYIRQIKRYSSFFMNLSLISINNFYPFFRLGNGFLRNVPCEKVFALNIISIISSHELISTKYISNLGRTTHFSKWNWILWEK